ncbi:hypothetical protein [Burkholderia sp. BCC0405]|uniref:hypothetical protein n=1 Tax=Burkholderia sp. BCC0405 TaxID=2676298 RepID=UPI00158B6E78|nr:hypothetical protein [Burkholderia sp. BCC0405]
MQKTVGQADSVGLSAHFGHLETFDAVARIIDNPEIRSQDERAVAGVESSVALGNKSVTTSTSSASTTGTTAVTSTTFGNYADAASAAGGVISVGKPGAERVIDEQLAAVSKHRYLASCLLRSGLRCGRRAGDAMPPQRILDEA